MTQQTPKHKPKIVFIEPKSPSLHIFSVFVIPRLGTLILGTIMKQHGWDVEVLLEEQDPIDFDSISSADIVGISTITSTAPRSFAIADRVRSRGIPVIMGGPHVSFLPDEALDHCDFVIRNEGEQALPLFLKKWKNKEDYSNIPNLSFRNGEQTIHNTSKELTLDLDTIPHPDFSLIKNGIKRTFGYRVIPMQTSRGCPFDCEFCSVTGMFSRKMRYRSVDNIIQELKHHNDKRNVIFFYDDNFTASRRRAKDLLKAMIAENFKFRWSTQVRADAAKDPEMVTLMKQAGCDTVFIGFESIDPENLVAMNKRQSVAHIQSAIQAFNKNKIQVHGMFVFGFENDNIPRIKETIRFTQESQIGSVQFLILTPFPGTETYRRLKAENRIVFDDWSLYDAHHPVFEPKLMNMSELQHAQISGHQAFYSRRQLLKRIPKGQWNELFIGLYARRLNQRWKHQHKPWLQVLSTQCERLPNSAASIR